MAPDPPPPYHEKFHLFRGACLSSTGIVTHSDCLSSVCLSSVCHTFPDFALRSISSSSFQFDKLSQLPLVVIICHKISQVIGKKMVKSCHKSSKVVKGCQKLSKNVKRYQKFHKSSQVFTSCHKSSQVNTIHHKLSQVVTS